MDKLSFLMSIIELIMVHYVGDTITWITAIL